MPPSLSNLRGVPYSVALFTKMSNAVHGLVSQPVFRIGAGIVETALAILFLIPHTSRLAAVLIAVWMIGPILSHVFVLGYGWIFINALATFVLPCIYLLLACLPMRHAPDPTSLTGPSRLAMLVSHE
jgi:hypothetical protein